MGYSNSEHRALSILRESQDVHISEVLSVATNGESIFVTTEVGNWYIFKNIAAAISHASRQLGEILSNITIGADAINTEYLSKFALLKPYLFDMGWLRFFRDKNSRLDVERAVSCHRSIFLNTTGWTEYVLSAVPGSLTIYCGAVLLRATHTNCHFIPMATTIDTRKYVEFLYDFVINLNGDTGVFTQEQRTEIVNYLLDNPGNLYFIETIEPWVTEEHRHVIGCRIKYGFFDGGLGSGAMWFSDYSEYMSAGDTQKLSAK
jgi:hypothetical protein